MRANIRLDVRRRCFIAAFLRYFAASECEAIKGMQMGWDTTYNRLIEILYGPHIDAEDLNAAVAIASIAVERRRGVTSEKIQQEFEGAVVEAGQYRRAGKMPPDNLKEKIRALFLDA